MNKELIEILKCISEIDLNIRSTMCIESTFYWGNKCDNIACRNCLFNNTNNFLSTLTHVLNQYE